MERVWRDQHGGRTRKVILVSYIAGGDPAGGLRGTCREGPTPGGGGGGAQGEDVMAD